MHFWLSGVQKWAKMGWRRAKLLKTRVKGSIFLFFFVFTFFVNTLRAGILQRDAATQVALNPKTAGLMTVATLNITLSSPLVSGELLEVTFPPSMTLLGPPDLSVALGNVTNYSSRMLLPQPSRLIGGLPPLGLATLGGGVKVYPLW